MFEFTGERQGQFDNCIPLSAIKSQLSLIDADDVHLASLVAAAQGAIEGLTRIMLTIREMELVYSGYGDTVNLGVSPVNSVSKVKIDGVETTDYTLYKYGLDPRIVFNNKITGQEIIITANVGHNQVTVPAQLQLLVKMLAADLYEHREAQAEATLTANANYMRLLNMYTWAKVS